VRRFFSNLNFPRAVILLCLTGSLVLGWLVFQRTRRLAEVQGELAQVPELLRDIQTKAFQLDALQVRQTTEKFKGQQNAETYIRDTGADDLANMGQLDITPQSRPSIAGVEDRIYKIKPSVKSRDYGRGNIGNFLYLLEKNSHRVKVTSINLTPAKKVKPGEIGDDRWTFEAEVMSRSKLEAKPATPPSQ
jgi:hypothetical protein